MTILELIGRPGQEVYMCARGGSCSQGAHGPKLENDRLYISQAWLEGEFPGSVTALKLANIELVEGNINDLRIVDGETRHYEHIANPT